MLYYVDGTSGERGERAPNLSWSNLPFRRFDHGPELFDRSIARFDRAVAHSDRDVAGSDRKNARTDPMIALLDLEIARLDGENSLAYGAIRQDDWPDAPPYPGMRPFDACNTPFPDRTFILVSRNSGEPSWSLPRLRPGTNLNGRLKLRF